MALDRIPCEQCGTRGALLPYNLSSTLIDPLLPPISDGPRVWTYRRRLPEGVEAIVKFIQAGRGYEFNRNPLHVQLITGQVTQINQLLSIEELERMDPSSYFYQAVMNHYKPWLEERAKDEILKANLFTMRWIVADTERAIRESRKSLEETDLFLAEHEKKRREIKILMQEGEARAKEFEAKRSEVEVLIQQFYREKEEAEAYIEARIAQHNALCEQSIAELQGLNQDNIKGQRSGILYKVLPTAINSPTGSFLRMAATAFLVVFFFIAFQQRLQGE